MYYLNSRPMELYSPKQSLFHVVKLGDNFLKTLYNLHPPIMAYRLKSTMTKKKM